MRSRSLRQSQEFIGAQSRAAPTPTFARLQRQAKRTSIACVRAQLERRPPAHAAMRAASAPSRDELRHGRHGSPRAPPALRARVSFAPGSMRATTPPAAAAAPRGSARTPSATTLGSCSEFTRYAAMSSAISPEAQRHHADVGLAGLVGSRNAERAAGRRTGNVEFAPQRIDRQLGAAVSGVPSRADGLLVEKPGVGNEHARSDRRPRSAAKSARVRPGGLCRAGRRR